MRKPKYTYLNPTYNILHGFNMFLLQGHLCLDYAWFGIGRWGELSVEKGALRVFWKKFGGFSTVGF